MSPQPDPGVASDLYLDGDAYDRMYAADGLDIEFYRALAKQVVPSGGARTLELACGTGKLLIPLAMDGHRVVGVDSAPDMLNAARRKCEQASVQLELVEADIRTISLDRAFDLVFIAGNSFCHMLTLSDAEACLAAVMRHLAPRGRFAVDVFVPDARMLARDADVRYPFACYREDDGREVTVTHAASYDPVLQIVTVSTYTVRAGEPGEMGGTLSLRMWYPAELEELLHYNRFRVLDRFGNHAFGPLSAKSGKQILICERA